MTFNISGLGGCRPVINPPSTTPCNPQPVPGCGGTGGVKGSSSCWGNIAKKLCGGIGSKGGTGKSKAGTGKSSKGGTGKSGKGGTGKSKGGSGKGCKSCCR